MRLVLMAVLVSGCSMYFGDDERTPDAAVIAAPDASATPDAAACPPQFQSCASLNCGEPLDCPWADSLSAPCACAEPTGLIHYCVRP